MDEETEQDWQIELARRQAAFMRAREIVQELYALKNDRGYPRFSGNVNSVLEEELKVARYLLDE